MNININYKIFNKLFKILKKYKESDHRFILCRGGAGSGKSYSITQHIILDCIQNKKKYLITRKYQSSLNDSVIDLFEEILNDWNLTHLYELNKTNKKLTFFNGSVLLFKGMDDSEKLKSISNLTDAWVEEATEVNEEDFNQLNLRLRGKSKMKIYLSFNPVSRENWIYKRFYDEYDRSNCLYTYTTYLDNKYIDPAYKKELLFYKNYDYNYYQVYALGQWGNLNTGNEFYKFKDSIISDVKYNKNLPLHISFDENVVPYLPAIVAQIENKKVNIIKEYTLKDPNNNIYDLSHTIINDFEDHSSGMIIYGDSTSNKRDTKTKDNNFFTILKKNLKQFNPTLRIPKANPGVKTRGDWINQVIALNRDGINVIIDKSCQKLIDDLQMVKQDPDGSKHKQKVTDKKTKIRYEKYGHLSDCFDYLLCEAFKEDYRGFKNGGKVNIQIPEYQPKINW